MIFPDIKVEEWKRRFNLPEIETPCAKCGQILKMEVPVLIQGCAGLSTPIHACGPEFVELILTPKSDEAERFWSSVAG
jgi:hypothetical protein